MNKDTSIQGKRPVSHRDSNIAIVYSTVALVGITVVVWLVNIFL